MFRNAHTFLEQHQRTVRMSDSKISRVNWSEALLLFAPLALTAIRRSSTLLLTFAAFITLIKERQNLGKYWRAARIDPALIIGFVVLCGWAGISLLWSPLPGRGLKQLAFDFVLPLLSGLVLLVVPAQPRSSRSPIWFGLALALAGGIVALQLVFQFRLEALLNVKERALEAWRFNMVLVTFALFLPAFVMITRRAPLPACAAIATIMAAILLSQSATAKVAALIALFTFVAASLLPRRLSLFLFAGTLFGLLAVQPWQGQLVERGFEAAGKKEVLFLSAQERIVIWQATGAVALNAMPWGTGMGSSDAVVNTPFATAMPPELAVGLKQTHAHNAFLNIMMELGLPGLLGLAAIAFGVVRTLARLPKVLFVPAMMLGAQIIIVDLISHGAWQAWWFTAMMLGLLAIKQYRPDTAA